MLDNAFNGYHATLFAYGQTGSGKSYSIIGYDPNIGIIPMACSELFRRIEESSAVPEANRTKFEVTVSMLEIYNEHIHDLFIEPKHRSKEGLKIRESPNEGIYVENLNEMYVNSYEDIA